MNKYVISDSKEIENLYYNFRKKKVEIILRYDLKEVTAKIYRITNVFITLFYKGDIDPNIESIEMNMTSNSNIYFSVCRVIKIASGEITLSLPEYLEKRVKRKYSRVVTNKNIYLKFNVISNINDKLDFVGIKSNISNKFTGAYKELSKPIPDIKKIITLISKEIKGRASVFEIKLYKKGDTYPKRIYVLKETKKTIFISSVNNSKSYIKSLPISNIMTYLPYIKKLYKKGKNKDSIKIELNSIMEEDKNLCLASYICSPIMLFDKVVGHIFLGLKENSITIFSESDAYIVKTGCNIISEALAKSRLHKLNTGDDFSVLVIDLSAGGLSMQFSDQFILKHISTHTRLRITLKVNEKEIRIIGNITRIDEQNDETAIVAVRFTDIRWLEQEHIEKYVNQQIEVEKSDNLKYKI